MTKLLLVDDEKNSRLAVEEYLSSRGFEVLAVADGESAVALGMETAPAVLVCDWLLPGELGGLDVAQSLLEALPDLRVIVVTGLPVGDVEREVAGIPLCAILSKPTSLTEIERAVRDAVAAGRRE